MAIALGLERGIEQIGDQLSALEQNLEKVTSLLRDLDKWSRIHPSSTPLAEILVQHQNSEGLDLESKRIVEVWGHFLRGPSFSLEHATKMIQADERIMTGSAFKLMEVRGLAEFRFGLASELIWRASTGSPDHQIRIRDPHSKIENGRYPEMRKMYGRMTLALLSVYDEMGEDLSSLVVKGLNGVLVGAMDPMIKAKFPVKQVREKLLSESKWNTSSVPALFRSLKEYFSDVDTWETDEVEGYKLRIRRHFSFHPLTPADPS